MNIYLENRQFAMILAPFVVSGGLYFFQTEITNLMDNSFSNYTQYSNKELDSKMSLYLELEKGHQSYEQLQDKVQRRSQNSNWVVENMIYRKKELPIATAPVVQAKPNRIEKPVTKTIEKIEEEEIFYRVEAIYPNDQTAILNGVIVRAGERFQDVKIKEIEQNRVLLENNKGLKWVYLFQ